MESRFENALRLWRIADAILMNLPAAAVGFDARALHATVPRQDSTSVVIEAAPFAIDRPALILPKGGKFFPDRQQASGAARGPAKRIVLETKKARTLPGVIILELRMDAHERLCWHAVIEVCICV